LSAGPDDIADAPSGETNARVIAIDAEMNR
jgi:hypothetical protein